MHACTNYAWNNTLTRNEQKAEESTTQINELWKAQADSVVSQSHETTIAKNRWGNNTARNKVRKPSSHVSESQSRRGNRQREKKRGQSRQEATISNNEKCRLVSVTLPVETQQASAGVDEST